MRSNVIAIIAIALLGLLAASPSARASGASVTSRCQGKPFGEVIHNPRLCHSDPHIEVQVKGDLGDAAYLTVVGPDGAVQDLTWTHENGQSCVYHWNLDAGTWNGGNPSPGEYQFSVSKASNQSVSVLDFYEDLSCSQPGKK